MNSRNLRRRDFIRTSSYFAIAVSMPVVLSCENEPASTIKPSDCLTSEDILGPFYKSGSPIRENIVPPGDTNPVLKITGKVFSGCDTPLQNALVEIWNANVEGEYDLSDAYHFRGSYQTSIEGIYAFQTIIPGHYLNGAFYRPSHIHFRVTAPGHRELISQIYFKNDLFIPTDPWASSPNAELRILEIKKEAINIDIVTFDIHLDTL